MHLSVKCGIFTAALFIDPHFGSEPRKWISVSPCLKREPFVDRVGLQLSPRVFVHHLIFCESKKEVKLQSQANWTQIQKWKNEKKKKNHLVLLRCLGKFWGFFFITVIVLLLNASLVLFLLVMYPLACLASSCPFVLNSLVGARVSVPVLFPCFSSVFMALFASFAWCFGFDGLIYMLKQTETTKMKHFFVLFCFSNWKAV